MKRKPYTRVSAGRATYRTLCPRGRKLSKTTPFARRLSTFEGKTVCELWDGLFRGDAIFLTFEKRFSERYPGVKFVRWTDFPRDGDHDFPDWKVHPNLLAEMGCDAVIVATGA